MSTRSREFWEGRYRTAAADGTSLWGAAPNGWVADQVGGLSLQPGRALDVGAGEGRNTFWLAASGWSVVATDFSTAAVDGMRARAEIERMPVSAYVADATDWVAPEPVDLAVLCYLQLESGDLAAAISRAADSLTPGGTLLGIWHDREDLARGLAGTMTPSIRTTPEETAAAARAAGLEIVLSGRRDREIADGLACDCLLIARQPDFSRIR